MCEGLKKWIELSLMRLLLLLVSLFGAGETPPLGFETIGECSERIKRWSNVQESELAIRLDGTAIVVVDDVPDIGSASS